jgi:hypothetical protein
MGAFPLSSAISTFLNEQSFSFSKSGEKIRLPDLLEPAGLDGIG